MTGVAARTAGAPADAPTVRTPPKKHNGGATPMDATGLSVKKPRDRRTRKETSRSREAAPTPEATGLPCPTANQFRIPRLSFQTLLAESLTHRAPG